MSLPVPHAVDAERFRTLAARIGASPRELLALAARLAPSMPQDTIDRAHIDGELARIRAAREAGDAGVRVLLLGFCVFASDDIDHALEIVWRGADLRMD
jgi:hypothetical protein